MSLFRCFTLSFLFSNLLGFGQSIPTLRISKNHRFLQTQSGEPFFWLGDTGWLLFTKLTREEAIQYLDDRKAKGFNVIQVMGLHTLKVVNRYGDSALVQQQVAHPKVTQGTSFQNAEEYDYWDHINFVIDEAAKRGIFIGFVPVWGSNIKSGKITPQQVQAYAAFLATRYGNKPNIIWLNGGDVRGGEQLLVWNTLGQTLRQFDSKHLITFHPRGRYSSLDWFHQEPWLDFNLFQSGHQTYQQDTLKSEKRHYGEDNWKYVDEAYGLTPIKPILDGEPSYEGIPHGLHDTSQPRWTDADLRRYAYWSVFAGAFGFTYGHNAVTQFFRNEADEKRSYGPLERWDTALNAPGASQLIYLKRLVEQDPSYFDRVPAQALILNQGQRYEYFAACQSKQFIYVYTFTGRPIHLQLGSLTGTSVSAYWYNPRWGEKTAIGTFTNQSTKKFTPPGTPQFGNDWVLVLTSGK